MIEHPFIYPDRLAIGNRKEAKLWAHGGCDYCDAFLKKGKRYKKARYLINLETKDVVGVLL